MKFLMERQYYCFPSLLHITINCNFLLIASFQIAYIRQDVRRHLLLETSGKRTSPSTFQRPRGDNGLTQLRSSLPPEAEEFFESLDQWAQNIQARKEHPLRRYLEHDLKQFLEDLNSSSTSSPLSQGDEEEYDNGKLPNELLNTNLASEFSVNHKKVLLDLDFDTDLDDDAPFLDTDEYLELCQQSIVEAYQEPDDWSTSMESSPIPMMMADKSFRDGLTNFIECETVPSAETTNEMRDIPEDDAVDQLLGLLRSNGRHANNYFNASVAEELDRQVFAQETGHQHSSDLFRRSLTNETIREEAITERRTRLFRERQREGLARLETMMQQFMEETIFHDNHDSTINNDEISEQDIDDDLGLEISRCSVCQRMLTAKEMELEICSSCNSEMEARDESERTSIIQNDLLPDDITLKRDSFMSTEFVTNRNSKRDKSDERTPLQPELQQVENSRPTDPWYSMIDPETKEVFYWNQETEEMRWESPAFDHSDEFE